MKRYYLVLLMALFFMQCDQKPLMNEEISIIPKPQSIILKTGEFLMNIKVSLEHSSELSGVATYLKEVLNTEHGIQLKENSSRKIQLELNSTFENKEAYELIVDNNNIKILAKSEKGIFYGIQSFLQMIPVQKEFGNPFLIPSVHIKDRPQFSYRGMHLDVGRHFYPVDFIKKYIDLIARLKMNTFHWHLTEDQGWRIEIKKYPKLQEIAAYRKETLLGHYSDQPHRFDGKKYGGYYTQEQIREVVAYAQKRQITIIPEIEMPGHSQAAVAAYPELGCTGKSVEVATKWGVFEEVYCPSEATFQFLEDVIDEVVQLFPRKYIHIGGDEAPKTRWKQCKMCQNIIREKGLKDEHGLQSYFIQRMEKYINSKGRQIIGWDEILEGGLAPNATVMSWRGVGGAVQAAKEKHNVILTPTSHCYFDYYQSDNENEPVAIGGFLPLKKVYHFNPIPQELIGKEESKYVLGAQGNVWTEYMPTSKQVEYMAFPRAAALSEAVWNKNKDYSDFIKRLEYLQKRWTKLDVNYANHLYEIKGELKQIEGELFYELSTVSDKNIVYSLDGKNPSLFLYPEYKDAIEIDSSVTIKAMVYDVNSEKPLGTIFEQNINFHKAVGAKISINKEPHPSYSAGGKKGLINGISGNNKRYGDSEWLGFWGEDIEITIDFDKPTEINSVSTRFHNGNGQWIYAPKKVEFYFDNDQTSTVANLTSESLLTNIKMELPKKRTVKTVHLIIPNYGKIPNGKQGAGNKAWTFIDEIIVE